jgi:protease I
MTDRKRHLEGLRVAILATDGFEEAELLEPRKSLDKAGAKTVVVSPKGGKIQGMRHHNKGRKVKVDLTLEEADPSQFDAAVLPGGALNADSLRMSKAAQAFVQWMDSHHQPIAVICHAPWLLVSANLTQGRTLTSYFTIQDDIRNSGAKWIDEEVVRDRNWVSSRKPDDIPAFNREMLMAFGRTEARAKAV